MKGKKIILMIIVAAIIFGGCSKNSIQSGSTPVGLKGYDTTQYNILFADAIKQKMLGNAGDALKYFEQAIKMNPASEASYYQISQIAHVKGDLKTAVKYAKQAHLLDQGNSWYINNLANIYFNLNNIDSVAWCYEKLIRLEPEREDMAYNLGSIYLQLENYDKALEIFSELNIKYKNNTQILMALLNIYKGLGEREKTEALLNNLIREEPENTNYLGLMAEYYRSTGRNAEALKIYEQLFELDPSSALLQLSYADFLLSEKQYDNLIKYLNTALINEKIKVDDKISLFVKIVGDTVLLKERSNELLLSAMVLKAAEKDNASIALLLADFYINAGNKAEAQKTLEDFLITDKSNYFVWERLLFLYNENQNIESLYKYSKEASSLFNRIPVPKLLYAFAATDKGEYDLALSELSKVRILANNQKEFMVQIFSLEADIYYRRGEYDKAFESFEEALKINSDDAFVLNNYAYFLAEQSKNLSRAKELIEKCILIENNPTNLDTYAWVLYKTGKFRKAEEIMKSIEEAGMLNDAELFEHYGFIKKA
ncbi:MAG: tetratricopeptide repeat protein, partial [Bacteroidales bacterium]|nr:tetratricopeptide repeat protein [Bacteroidales bacterium]